MRPSRLSRVAAIALINLRFFASALLGVTAWLIWPQTTEWWGLGLIAVVLGAASVRAAVSALQGLVRLLEHDRALAAFEALGREAKSSNMAGLDRLRQAGMLDD